MKAMPPLATTWQRTFAIALAARNRRSGDIVLQVQGAGQQVGFGSFWVGLTRVMDYTGGTDKKLNIQNDNLNQQKNL
jgi:hypothetical protein